MPETFEAYRTRVLATLSELHRRLVDVSTGELNRRPRTVQYSAIHLAV